MSDMSTYLYTKQIFTEQDLLEEEVLQAIEAMYEKSIWGDDSFSYFFERTARFEEAEKDGV